MGRINLLRKEVSELIAAGEVIERPSSIVKELLENSIDAGATVITVEIKRGGIAGIRVTDNGSGMEKADLEVAFLRHATSKLNEPDDLDRIGTLGFRGEALASIAAVSRVSMSSKTSEMQFGNKIEMEAGEITELDETGCPNGTTIIVRDLFYNIPARLKFLKKDASEGNSINGIMDKLALSHPEISFKLISEGKIKLFTPGDEILFSAVRSVFGGEFAESLIPLEYEMNRMRITGYITKPQLGRSNRAMQHFFVNGRYVRSKTCMASLEQGYKNTMMVGKYPSCVLNITMPLDSVDVNVHPAKIEIRFVNERLVFDLVYFAVKSTLTKNDILKSPLSPINNATVPMQKQNLLSTFFDEASEQTSINKPSETLNVASVNENDFTDAAPDTTKPFFAEIAAKTTCTVKQVSSPQTTYRTDTFEASQMPRRAPNIDIEYDEPYPTVSQSERLANEEVLMPQGDTPIAVPPEEKAEQQAVLPFVRVIGELFKVYLLFEADETFYLLDKHAAHERIIYEKLKKSVLNESGQALLSPVVVALSAEECEAVMNRSDWLIRLGFLVEEFGNHSVIVREAPMYLPLFTLNDVISDLAKEFMENRREVFGDALENLLHSMACRAAIKANDTTDISELTELLRQVYANDEIRHCPHGRPVIIAMTKKEIEKKFGRI